MTTAPDLEAVHAAILADPDDDLCRLAYADCLEERGGPGDDARAEQVRRQIADPAAIIDCKVFFAKAGPLFVPEAEGAILRRGFVDEVRLSTADWHAHGPRLVREHPIRVVRLTDKIPCPAWENRPLVDITGARTRGRPQWTSGPAGNRHTLPAWLWGRMAGRHLGASTHETIEEAYAELSKAALAWAKTTRPARPTPSASRRSATSRHIAAGSSPGTSRPGRSTK